MYRFVPVKRFFIAPLGRRPQGLHRRLLDVCHAGSCKGAERGWADVGLWVAVCFLAKISLHRPTCKTTFARLTQSRAISLSFRVFITFRSMRDTTFFHFSKLIFCTKYPFFYHGDQKMSWWCRWRAVNFEIHLWSSGMNADCIWRSISIQHVQIEAGLNSDPGNDSFSVEIRDAKHVDRSILTSRCRSTQVKLYTGLIASIDLWPQEMFTFSEMLALVQSERVWKQFQCLRLS